MWALKLNTYSFPRFVELYNRACAEHRPVVLFEGFQILVEEAGAVIQHLRPVYK